MRIQSPLQPNLNVTKIQVYKGIPEPSQSIHYQAFQSVKKHQCFPS